MTTQYEPGKQDQPHPEYLERDAEDTRDAETKDQEN